LTKKKNLEGFLIRVHSKNTLIKLLDFILLAHSNRSSDEKAITFTTVHLKKAQYIETSN